MFLSLVRPERISSPITSSAAVTTSWGADELAVVMAARVLAARRSGPSLPCHCALSCFKPSAGGARSRPSKSPGRAGGRWGGRQMPGPARLRPIYARPCIVCEPGHNGALLCRSSEPLAPCDPSLARLFRAAVERNPGGLFLAESDGGGGWRKVTYAAGRTPVEPQGASLDEL